MVNSISFNNGIYIVFETGEKYRNIDRIVRVGTHIADGRLRARLKNHFIRENKNCSVFRKNIGMAILNRNDDRYLETWRSNIKPIKDIDGFDPVYQKQIESAVSRYIHERLTFTCFHVATKEERLRLETGIISTLNKASDFSQSPEWLGHFSPLTNIVKSGMWLEKGLNGNEISSSEYETISSYCRCVFSASIKEKQR